MTRDQLMEALLVERYGPTWLPPVVPQPLVRAPADEAAPPPPPRRRGHLTVLDGGSTTAADVAARTTDRRNTMARISLDADQVQLLTAVQQGRVHHDPRFTRPDFEKEPGPPMVLKRATQRLAPLKRQRLVELAPESEALGNGVRLYKTTTLGDEVLAEVRRQEDAANADPDRVGGVA